MKAGFSRIEITPPLGLPISGYYEARYVKGVLDPLYVTAVAFDNGKDKCIIITLDIIMLTSKQCDVFRKITADFCSVSPDAVFITCSHTHTGPMIGPDFASDLCGDELYHEHLKTCVRDAAKYALDDASDAQLSTAESTAEKISFIRRFRMKDGSVQTNPGVGNPNIECSLGTPDERVKLVKLTRQNKDDIFIINFGVHPDVIGGEYISADYPGFVRSTIESAVSNTKCMFLTGAQGDVNHINSFAQGAERNGLCYDSFDGVPRGYEHAIHMGRVIAGAALQICGKTKPAEDDAIAFMTKTVSLPTNKENDKLPWAENVIELHKSGRDSELPYKEMELTTEVARANRIIVQSKNVDSLDFSLTALSIGGIAFFGLPGEPFVEIGRKIQEASPFDETVVCCLTNGGDCYFPTSTAYDEGGYEAATATLKKGAAEILIENGAMLLKSLSEISK